MKIKNKIMKFSKIICLFFVVRFVETLPVPTPTSPPVPTDTTLQFTDSHDTTRGYDVTSSLPQSVDVTDELNTTSFEEELTFDDGSGDVLDLESIVVERLLPSDVPLFEEETQTVENLRESDTSTSLFDIQDELVNTTDQSTGTRLVSLYYTSNIFKAFVCWQHQCYVKIDFITVGCYANIFFYF